MYEQNVVFLKNIFLLRQFFPAGDMHEMTTSFHLINMFHSKRIIPVLIHLQFPTFAIDVNQCPSFFCQSNASSFGIVFLLVKSDIFSKHGN